MAMREETFGPVVAVYRVGSVAEAVRLAEESRYGLAASVFGGDPSVPARLSRSRGPARPRHPPRHRQHVTDS